MSIFENLLSKLADPSSLRHRPGTRTSSTQVSPTFATSSASASTLENLTRTIRGYVPSSIAIPPSPSIALSNSRGLGVGLIGTSSSPPSHEDHPRAVSQQEFEREYELHDEEDNEYYVNEGNRHSRDATAYENVDVPASSRQFTVTKGSSGLAQAMQRNIDNPPEQVETIIWARWDDLHDQYAFRFLILLPSNPYVVGGC
jgi:hypothetical protein